jgi:glutaredoxin
MNRVKVYGADWCKDTRHARERMDNMGVGYDYINIEQDKDASDWVKQQNGGKERKPTIKIDERVLSVPKDDELEKALREQGIL